MGEPARQDRDAGSSNVIAFRRPAGQGRNPAMPEPDYDDDRRRVRSNIAALVFAGLLVVVGLMLVRVLAEKSRLDDCLMSGRTNCLPIEAPPRGN